MDTKTISTHLNMQAQIVATRYSTDKRTAIFTLRFTNRIEEPATRMHTMAAPSRNTSVQGKCTDASCPDLFFALWDTPLTAHTRVSR